MFSWGEDCRQGFRLKGGGSDPAAGARVHLLNLGFGVEDLSAGPNALSFIKSSGGVFIIRTQERQDGARVTEKLKPVKSKERIRAVCCGDDSVTLLSEEGKVLCVDTTHTPFTPRVPEALPIPVSQVACGSQHTLALTKDGQVFTWGQDSRGQLGLGQRPPGPGSPRPLRSLAGVPLVQVAAGGEQSFALSVSGGVFGWGANACGQLGLGDRTDRHTPTAVQYLNMKKTVHISCGKEHTAILTKDGAVFTFGSGQYGQLGHNSLSDELRPRLVAEVWGAKVTRTACGWYHTLVLTDCKKVYSFGCGEQGQLGHGEESHPSIPLPVLLPQDNNQGLVIGNIYAGGNRSFATCTSIQGVHDDRVNNSPAPSIDQLIDKLASDCDAKSLKKMKQELKEKFASAFCLNQSFLDRGNDKHFQTSAKYSGVDLSLAQSAFEKLVKKDEVMTEVESAVLQVLPTLEETPVGVEGLRIFLLLHELLHVMQRHSRKESTRVAETLAAAVRRLTADGLQVIVAWWSSLPSSTRLRHVSVWKQAFLHILTDEPNPQNPRVQNLLFVLQNMYDANKRTGRHERLREKTFGLGFSEKYLENDLQLWRSSQDKDKTYQPLVLRNFPFVMDLKSKKTAFDISVKHIQVQPRRIFFSQFISIPDPNPYFELWLRRNTLLEDTFAQLSAANEYTFKKQLWVFLDEDTEPTNVYRTDLFHHSFREMVSPEYELFMFNDSGRLAWFPSKETPENKRKIFLFGILCGLALFNQSLVYLPFPLALFKKLLDVEPTLHDMKEFCQVTGKTLQDILDSKDEDVKKLRMSFMINWDGTEVDLDPQNPDKPVTSQNRKEFVDAYVNHALNTSVDGVFQEFKRGFFQVCDPVLVKLFTPKELQRVLAGQDVYDWTKLRRNTVFDDIFYYADHPVMQMFWEVFDELTEDEKKDFIWFLTGYRRVPILGMNQIKMTVRLKLIESGTHDEHRPEALTCHSIMYLPSYSSKEILRVRLTEALKPERGFLE